MNPRNISVAGFARAQLAIVVILLFILTRAVSAQPQLEDRVRGLVVGSIIGDAVGGPLEFQKPLRSSWTANDVVLSDEGIADLAARFQLRPYTLRPEPESYGQWLKNAPAGTVTDDTRFKILFMRAFRAAGIVDRHEFAEQLLSWHADTLGMYGTLPREWLDEFAFAAEWEVGERNLDVARPPERQWGGLATMAGQMPFLLAAAVTPGDPTRTYRTVWEANFLDNGIGRDQTASLAAGLSAALVSTDGWDGFLNAVRTTDPFGFDDVPWVDRRVVRWIDRAHQMAIAAESRPYRLFQILEQELGAETWWESWVPVTVVLACAEVARYDPLATLELILEFGHDTDSYLQLGGAIVGAVNGYEVFPESIRETVALRLTRDYSESINDWVVDLTSGARAR